MKEENEEIKLPISKWLLFFDESSGLEQGFIASSSKLANKNMKISTIFVLMCSLPIFVLLIIIFVR